MVTAGGHATVADDVAFWIAAMLHQGNAVMLPFVLLCLDRLYFPDSTEQRTGHLATDLPMARRSPWRCARPRRPVSCHARATPAKGGDPVAYRPRRRNVMLRYAFLVILPVGQSIFHAIVPATSVFSRACSQALPASWRYSRSAWKRGGKNPIISVGLMLVSVAPAPILGMMVMDSSGDMSEHRVYLASVGPFLMRGALFGWLAATTVAEGTPVRWAAVLLLPAALLSLSGRTLLRNAMWSSPS
jgi:hypothetical protein